MTGDGDVVNDVTGNTDLAGRRIDDGVAVCRVDELPIDCDIVARHFETLKPHFDFLPIRQHQVRISVCALNGREELRRRRGRENRHESVRHVDSSRRFYVQNIGTHASAVAVATSRFVAAAKQVRIVAVVLAVVALITGIVVDRATVRTVAIRAFYTRTELRPIFRPCRRRCYVAMLTLIVGIDGVIVVADVDAVLGYGASARSARRDATVDFTCRSALARLTGKTAVQQRALAYSSACALFVVGAGVSVVASLIRQR